MTILSDSVSRKIANEKSPIAAAVATVAQVAATAVEEAADLDQAMGDVASTRQGDNQSKVVIQESQVC